MSTETELREALLGHAATVESTESDPYARVHAAVATSRRRRRTVAAASLATALALAVGAPAVTSRWGDDPGVTLPGARPSLPGADSPVWRSVGSWPLRGSLAGDRALVDGLDRRFEGRTILAEDLAQTRVALVVIGEQLAVVTGPRGSGSGAMDVTTTTPLAEVGPEGVVTLAGQGALLVLSTPGLTSAEVSGTPAIALDGTVSRTWQPIGLEDGVGRSTSVPLTRVRVGGSMGAPRFTFGEGDRTDESQACEGTCDGDDLARFEERNVDEEVARALMLDADTVDTRTAWHGRVPDEIAAAVTGDVPEDARTTVQVVLSTLPRGQVLRTIFSRTDAATEGRAWDVERLNPVAADTAELRPAVLSTAIPEGATALIAWVLAPVGSTVRAVSPDPTVWPTSVATPVRDGVARIELGVDNATFENEYSLEVRRADGSLVGTWPAAPGTSELSAP